MLNKSNTTSNSKRKNMTIFRSYFVIFDGLMIMLLSTYIYICVCNTSCNSISNVFHVSSDLCVTMNHLVTSLRTRSLIFTEILCTGESSYSA